jgi:ABC-2 type transport system permease protein
VSDRVPTRETDRGMWRVVARRDFRVRLRDKGFVISTAITITVLSIFILIRAYGGGGTPGFDLGFVKGGGSVAGAAGALATQAAALGPSAGVEVRVRPVTDPAAGERQLSQGSLDALLEPGPVLVSKSGAPGQLSALVEAAAQRAGVRSALEDAGVSPDRIAGVMSPPPIAARTLSPPDPNRQSNGAVAFIGVLLLYGQLFGYGVWVATGVIEEKASRVVEILLSSIRARQLLAGKIAGIGTLGLLQLVCIAGFAIALATTTGAIDFPVHAIGAAVLVLGWFVLGFSFYASLFAVAGSLVSRMEDLQNVIVPLNLVILASLFISIGAVQDPGSTIARVASVLPFSSALAMPVRITLGSATPIEIVASVVLLASCTAGMVPLAGRLYSGAVLRIGAKVRLRDAWRSAS